MKKQFLLVLLIFNSQYIFGQDSTQLPKFSSGSFEVTTYRNISAIPNFIKLALDSINGEPLVIYDIGAKLTNNENSKLLPEREIRRVDEYSNAWLLTYVHRKESNHIHFVVFIVNKNKIQSITAGISNSDIDSIFTLEEGKKDKSVTFINLKSKKQTHKL